MNGIVDMPWWEREKLLTAKDKDAVQRAIYAAWEEIDTDWAETDAGRYELDRIRSSKMHRDEYAAGLL